jgi:hypothetical protein
VTEQPPPYGSAAPRPIPDLGFFAGPPSRGTSSVAPAPVFGAPAPVFGVPQSPDAWRAGPPAAAKTSMSSSVKVVALVIGLLLIAGSVTAGRFGWRHFVADPVVPDTLQGMPRITDPSFEAGTQALQDSVKKDLTAGSKAEVGLYSNGRGLGYMLFALRGSSRPGQGNNDDELKDAAKTTHGDVQCYAMPAAPGDPVAATLCMRSFYRRAVLVMAFGVTRPDPAMVAKATDEAWKAQ